jgi:putative radical SAM enzyme (TIGR03279 family)
LKSSRKDAAGNLITGVQSGSIADQLKIRPGDMLLSVNGKRIEDIFDYRFQISSESMTMDILKKNGEEWELEIENNYEDPGLDFENGLMSEYRSCSNKCIFCFIDQMPKGMRDTLYFKDDDSRLSFLQGNYITLTNMKEKDIRRIIKYRLEPINISVHTTNPALRCRMLNNRFAGEKLSYIRELYEAGIKMNGQIVLCRDYNDGKELEKTFQDLMAFAPVMESISVVPVGITRFREGLTKLQPILKEDAAETVRLVERFQKEAFRRFGIHLFHASDEFYLLSGMPIPETDRYDGFPQLENGVGMIRLQRDEVRSQLKKTVPSDVRERIGIVTGELAYPDMKKICGQITRHIPAKKITVFPVKNDFFGERITVTGLLTGKDILNQLQGKDLGDRLLLPSCMFRSGEEVLLDDMAKKDLEKALGIRISIIGTGGSDLVKAVNSRNYRGRPKCGGYEMSAAAGPSKRKAGR